MCYTDTIGSARDGNPAAPLVSFAYYGTPFLNLLPTQQGACAGLSPMNAPRRCNKAPPPAEMPALFMPAQPHEAGAGFTPPGRRDRDHTLQITSL